ncbi:MAG: aminoacyl-tRNA hydrolase [Gammaproteobacteria bacterium]
MAIQLIMGLGNPGPDYTNTRHNVGVWFLAALFEQEGLKPRFEAKLKAFLTDFGTVKCGVASTYMNLSGDAVLAVAKYYQIPPDKILVVHDELDLDVGTVRLKHGGGHAGHNGLRDIIAKLGSSDFHRLRIGIGRPSNQQIPLADYVLSRPNKYEESQINQALAKACAGLPSILAGNWSSAMQYLHSNN